MFNSFSAGIVFRRQNHAYIGTLILTSNECPPALKGLNKKVAFPIAKYIK